MGEMYGLLQTSSCSPAHSPGLACAVPLAVAVGLGM